MHIKLNIALFLVYGVRRMVASCRRLPLFCAGFNVSPSVRRLVIPSNRLRSLLRGISPLPDDDGVPSAGPYRRNQC